MLGLCLISVFAAVLIKQYKPEYATLISVAACCAVIVAVAKNLLNPVFELRRYISAVSGTGGYYQTAVKVVAIGYITKFTADVCNDAGQTAIAGKAELAGKAAVFITVLPLVNEILNKVTEMIG